MPLRSVRQAGPDSLRNRRAAGRLKADRQATGTENVKCLTRFPGLVAGQLDILEPLQEIGQTDPGLESGERCPDAEMDPVPECDVRIGIARDVEAVRLGKLPWIAVCRADH